MICIFEIILIPLLLNSMSSSEYGCRVRTFVFRMNYRGSSLDEIQCKYI